MKGQQPIRRAFVQLPGGSEHEVVRHCLSAAGCLENQEPRKLCGNLFEVLEILLRGKNVAGGLVVNHYRITNGFGALPATSIQTLLVCRYSRIASMPFSRPIPDRL